MLAYFRIFTVALNELERFHLYFLSSRYLPSNFKRPADAHSGHSQLFKLLTIFAKSFITDVWKPWINLWVNKSVLTPSGIKKSKYWKSLTFTTLFGNQCKFFINLSIRLKICRTNVCFFFARQNLLAKKIGRALEVLHAQERSIGIGHTICPAVIFIGFSFSGNVLAVLLWIFFHTILCFVRYDYLGYDWSLLIVLSW